MLPTPPPGVFIAIILGMELSIGFSEVSKGFPGSSEVARCGGGITEDIGIAIVMGDWDDSTWQRGMWVRS
jgi:hypothetical protein